MDVNGEAATKVASRTVEVSNKRAGSEANGYLSVSVKRSGYLRFGFGDYFNDWVIKQCYWWNHSNGRYMNKLIPWRAKVPILKINFCSK